MKLLFLIPSLRPGGAERQLVELVKGLDKGVYDIWVVSTDEVNVSYREVLEGRGVEVLCFGRRSRYDLRPIFKIVKLVRTHRIDVIHSFLMLSSIFGLIAATLTRRPLIASALRTARPAGRLDRMLGKLLASGADYLVSNSSAAFANRFSKCKGTFRVIYNGMDFERFKPQADTIASIKKDLGYRPECKYVGMVASLSRKKDQETLLAAASIVIAAMPATRFILVGEDLDHKEARLKDIACELGIDDKVMLTGYTSQSDQMMWLFDVIVLLTHPDYLEGCPNAVIEAMAIGKPVVASRGGGTNEVVRDGETGLLVAPGHPEETADRLLRLLSDRVLSKEMAKRGQASAKQQFSMQTYVENYERLYAAAIR